MMIRTLRLILLVAGLVMAVAARAELSCDQLVASAEAGIAMRDQGATLKHVLAQTENAEMRARLKPEELATLRRVIRLTYTGEVSIYELAGSCAESKDGASRR